MIIRLVLLTVAAANFFAAYLFFFTPEVIGDIYQLQVLDNMHRFLTMNIGALLSAFGLGALVAFFRPVKYGSIIIMLLLMHFMIFIVDVVVLARGQMRWEIIVPEMIYFLVVSTALVRWYPIREKKMEKQEDASGEVKMDSKESEEGDDNEDSSHSSQSS